MMQKSILLIDDDVALTELLSEYLQPQGYQVTVAHDGAAGLTFAQQHHYDLILLDVMLPQMDGFEVLKRLRLTHLTPVLMLTARGDDFDRIFGLELGADDYLPKPFNHRELSARIKAIVRRMEYVPQMSQQQDLEVAGLILRPATQKVTCNDEDVILTGTEFAVLHLLMMNTGQIVSKEDISEKVLGRKLQAFDRSIDMHVSNIRKKLAAGDESERIKTIRGSGYMLMGA